MPSITGGVVLVSSRILMPMDVATVRPYVVLPVTGTVQIGNVFGTLAVNIPSPVEAVTDYIGTIDIMRNVLYVDTVAQISEVSNVVNINTLSVVGTVSKVQNVGFVEDGKITASVLGTVTVEGRISASITATIAGVGTLVNGKLTASVLGGILDNTRFVGTVATIVEGKLTASIIGGGGIATIGTIVQGKLTASIFGTVVTQTGPAIYTSVDASAVISATPGRFYGILVTMAGTTSATVLVLNIGAPTPLSTILARVIVGAAGTSSFALDRGVGFSTLAASIIGVGVLANIYYG